MVELWKNLKNLVLVDKELNEIISIKNKINQIIKKDKIEIPQLENQISDLEKLVFDKKKNIALIELEAKALNEREISNKAKLEKVKNPKEYSAIEKELKSIELKSLEHDNILEKEWLEFESLENDLKNLKNETLEKIKQRKEGILVQEEALKEQCSKHDALELKRKEYATLIPAEWLNKYERMRHKVPNPIVPVINSVCSSCYYTILRQDLAKLKQSGVLLCRNCYRFLYYDAQEETDSKSEGF